jgi:hypothetical protein
MIGGQWPVLTISRVCRSYATSAGERPAKLFLLFGGQLGARRSARVADPVLVNEYPTAVHSPDGTQDTPLKRDAPAAFGVVWTCQVEPFQNSATVEYVWPFDEVPTAVQTNVVGHDMATSSVNGVGIGTVCTCQAAPFHRSANVGPTAVHAEINGQETSCNTPPPLAAVG